MQAYGIHTYSEDQPLKLRLGSQDVFTIQPSKIKHLLLKMVKDIICFFNNGVYKGQEVFPLSLRIKGRGGLNMHLLLAEYQKAVTLDGRLVLC